MNKKRTSVLGTLGWSLLADVALLATVLLLISLFSFSSISRAYLVAAVLLLVCAVVLVLYKRRKRKVV